MLIQSLLRITRFWNLLIIAVTQYASAYFLAGHAPAPDAPLVILVVSTMLIAAGGYIINDYYDVKIDLINKPDRVVIGKTISRRAAILFHTGMSVTGVAMGFLLNWKIGLINLFSAFLLWLYSNALKRLPLVGNLAVSLLTGLAVLIVNILYPPLLIVLWVYALFAFLITLVREIIKDIEDLKGDSTFGCRTLPIAWGVRKTKQLVYVLLVVFALVVFALHLRVTPLPLNYFAGFLFLPMLGLLVWLVRADTRTDFTYLSQYCKVIMLLGVISMAFV